MKIRKMFEGTCGFCRKESKYLERDHRVPPRLGGTNHESNIQHLCLDCHMRKSALEASLMSFSCTTDIVKEWFKLAFQEDSHMAKMFVSELGMRVTHFREVAGDL